MAYGANDRLALHSGMADGGLGAAIAVGDAAADKFVFTVLEPIVVFGLRCLVTTAIADMGTTASQVALDHRPNYGADTGRAEKAVITTVNATPAGKVFYKDCAPFKALPGQQLVVEQKRQGVGGGGLAGAMQPFIIYAPAPETPGNCPNMIASA
jgi:hypothetical protein